MDKTLVGREELAGAVTRRSSVFKFFEKLHKMRREIPVLESLLNEVAGLKTCNFTKK